MTATRLTVDPPRLVLRRAATPILMKLLIGVVLTIASYPLLGLVLSSWQLSSWHLGVAIMAPVGVMALWVPPLARGLEPHTLTLLHRASQILVNDEHLVEPGQLRVSNNDGELVLALYLTQFPMVLHRQRIRNRAEMEQVMSAISQFLGADNSAAMPSGPPL